MKYLFQLAFVLLAATVSVAPAAELRIDSASPAAAVVRHFGWLESGLPGDGVEIGRASCRERVLVQV